MYVVVMVAVYTTGVPGAEGQRAEGLRRAYVKSGLDSMTSLEYYLPGVGGT